jgi:glucosamine-6-phosphate deaminase
MEISIFDTAEEALRTVAQRVVRSLKETPDLILGLSAGRTPVGAYAELRRMHRAGDVDFSRATSFNLDEFAGIERTHPGSFHRFMAEHLLSGVNLPAHRVHSLNGGAPDLDAECERYEDQLAMVGGIGLQLLGIGANGHIGFNEPADALVSRTHRVTLLEATRRENATLFGGDPAQVPREALSMGMGTILKANTLVMIATGAGKAASVERMVRGPIVTQLPASFLQTHRHVEVYLDRAAAARL